MTLITVVAKWRQPHLNSAGQLCDRGGLAVAGTDYTPVSGTLTFGANQTSTTFTVPILQGGDTAATRTVGLVLSSPSMGAQPRRYQYRHAQHHSSNAESSVWPAESESSEVTGEQLVLGPAGITAIQFSFNMPLNASRVPDLGNYGYYVDLAGPAGTFGTTSDVYIPLSAAQYNTAASTITVYPSTALPLNRFVRITLNGLANPLLNRGLISTSASLAFWPEQRGSRFSVRSHLRRRLIACLHGHAGQAGAAESVEWRQDRDVPIPDGQPSVDHPAGDHPEQERVDLPGQ